MRFGVLGPLAVWTDAGEPVRVPEAKVRALLADLLVTPGRPVPADRLVDDLWGDRPPRNPSGTLQARVSQLRKVLEDAEPGGRELVVFGPSGYTLRVDDGAVDAGRFSALAARARQAADPHAKVGLLTDALALWRGPAFADVADAPFARSAIARLEDERLAALEEQAEARLDLGDHVRLAADLADAVARHPLRERLRAAHLLALYRAGRQGDALAGYEELRRRLAEELGVDPSPELAGLHQAMLRQSPSLAPVRRRTNLPAAPLGDLVGRESAVAGTRALVAAHRLVTLTGPGGVGKTRLALEAAARAADDFPDGVWLAELAPLPRTATADEVADVLTAVLGVCDDPGPDVPPERRLAEAVRAREALLVLDNCEHVVEPVAALVGRLLEGAPKLRVLATSREPLGLSGERLFVVPPLDEPSAVRLFAERAAATAPGFALDAGNRSAVTTICRRLDGLPLALELAATRVRALGVQELAARLDDRFRLLAAGPRDAPARQRTLRAVIDWSWEPLTEAERLVLRRLAVHADGCTLEAAEEVCAEDGVDVLDVLPRLVDRSLVVVAPGPRYRLLESVTAYCRERLRDAGEDERIRRRHVTYYTRLAERAAPRLRGRGQRAWLERLDRESANLRVALDHAGGDDALRLVNALTWYWFLRSRFGEARRSLALALSKGGGPAVARADAETWLTGMTLVSHGWTVAEEAIGAALKPYDDLDAPPARARAAWFLSFVFWGYGDHARHRQRVDEALAVFRAHGDRWGEAAALSTRAKLAIGRGDLAGLRRDAEHSLRVFTELGDEWGRLEATHALTHRAEITGDYAEAERLIREALPLAEDLGMWSEVSFRLSALGRIMLLTGDLTRARELHERALRLAVDRSAKAAQEFAEIGLGLVARRAGDLDAAEAHLRAPLEWLRGVGGTPGVALVMAQLGYIAEARGDAATALARHREGYEAALSLGDPRAIALALEGLAGAHSLAGEHAHAARLLGAAATAREAVGTPLPPAERGDVDRATARCRAALGAAAFAAEFSRGNLGHAAEVSRA
ncbi:AfsR/SARP family transcriptional regulator [Actinomadura miaoliensis]|uniref:BTAD domain-containing putative transcriptional regulator n=1 Tax=Actinomadura miaoliensis TaxID=430685 RepID=A0ABP7X5I4_9ACTN